MAGTDGVGTGAGVAGARLFETGDTLGCREGDAVGIGVGALLIGPNAEGAAVPFPGAMEGAVVGGKVAPFTGHVSTSTIRMQVPVHSPPWKQPASGSSLNSRFPGGSQASD